MTKGTKILTALLASAICIALAPVVPAQAASSSPSAYWGASIGNHLTGSAPPYDMAGADAFEALAGKRMGLIGFSLPWASCYEDPCTFKGFPTAQMDAIRQRGAIPVFSWASYSQPLSENQPDFRLSKITAGTYDPYLRKWAQDAKSWGHAFFLNFDWEMNLNGQWPYSEAVNGNRPGDFVKMWRHVHDVFEQEGADNVTWSWCPNISYPGSLDIPSLYPGDDVVDWTCIDGYSWWYKWTPFGQMLGPTYDTVQAIAPDKPVLIGETAASEIGGSKAAWITDMLGEQLQQRFRNVKGVMWYEQKDPRLAQDDPAGWPIESSASSQAAFAAGIASPYYAANTFSDVSSPIPPLSPVVRTQTPSSGGGQQAGVHSGTGDPTKLCVRRSGRTVCTKRCVRRTSRTTRRKVIVCRKQTMIRALTVKPTLRRSLRPAAPDLAVQASFGFTLADDATLTLRFQRRSGRRWLAVPGNVRLRLTKGERGITFGGRLSATSVIPAGAYRVTLTPVDTLGRTGRSATAAFALRG